MPPTPLSAEDLSKAIEQLLDQHRAEKERLDRIAQYLGDTVNGVLYVPKGATDEYRLLVDQSRFNVLPLVVQQLAQALFVDGYRPTGPNGRAPSADNSPIWDRVWQPNRMDARQGALHRDAITYGYSYALALPGAVGEQPTPVITPYSPRTLTALYDDPLHDEWPRLAMTVKRMPNPESADEGTRLCVYDANFRYDVQRRKNKWELDTEVALHGLGVVPVVRYLDEQRTDILPRGKVEPLFPAQRQLNQITFGLAMALQYGAFKQRWVTGMSDESPNFRVLADAMLRAESVDTKFGQFDETDVSGYLEARDKVLLFVASIGQIPPHNLLVGAGISNISAEALAALEAGHRQDINEHQTSFGESHEQLMRLCGKAIGGEEGNAAWDDLSAQVVWRDTTPRSLAQVADALGKLATQLGIPVKALWERIPGVTDQDIKRWENLANEQELMDELKTLIEAPRTPVAVGSGNGANPTTPG